jgi:lipopolysaccharide transport system ATP-binding protein
MLNPARMTAHPHRSALPFTWDRPSHGNRAWSWLKRRLAIASELPTVFHVTHFKAGSQWVNRILQTLAYDRIVLPEVEGQRINVQYLDRPIQGGKVYPTVYVTRDEFESVNLPPNSRRFVVIRDLRDTLVSAYFSIKNSHEMSQAHDLQMRAHLHEVNLDAGLMFLMDEVLDDIATLQQSWLGGPDDIIKYEDMLTRDEEILKRVLLDHCELPVEAARFREVVVANRFESRAGRKRGTEDAQSHERKGIAGDWRNYFSDAIVNTFKSRYGELLVATGYESNDRW